MIDAPGDAASSCSTTGSSRPRTHHAAPVRPEPTGTDRAEEVVPHVDHAVPAVIESEGPRFGRATGKLRAVVIEAAELRCRVVDVDERPADPELGLAPLGDLDRLAVAFD